MRKKIAVLMPNRGVGDALFHYRFCKSLSIHHKKKIFLIAPDTTKANLIYKKNKFIYKVLILNLRRPSLIGYFRKIFYIINNLKKYNFEKIYYTGDHKWQIISIYILKLFKKFNFFYLPIKNYYIVDHLDLILRKLNITLNWQNDLNIKSYISKKNKVFLGKYKKPWVFLSIDTAADQIEIPKNYLNLIIKKLKKKYNTIFINTNHENKKKLKPFQDKKIVHTYKYNILEINYIIKNSKLFIGNDSGPGNLSSFVNHKSIIFLSKNTKGEIKKIKARGQRIYINVEHINKNILKLLKFI